MARKTVTDLDAESWRFVARSVVRRFVTDQCPDKAAGLTFYAILTLIPAVMVVVSLVSLLGTDSELLRLVVGLVSTLASERAADVVMDVIDELASSSIAWIALLGGIALTLWSGSRYVAAFSRAMNLVYRADEGRRLWKMRVTHLAIALALLVAAIIAVVVVGVSDRVLQAIDDQLGWGDAVLITWRIVRWPLLVFAVVLALACLSYFSSNVRHPRFRWMTFGATSTLAALLIASLLFSLYTSNVANYERIYGSLAGVIVFLLWLWIANMALLGGVEFDAAVERARELKGDEPAEHKPRLALRDTVTLPQKAKRERHEVAAARNLRPDADD
ncbi:YihY/virulence factor BrkB family protein [Microbacterium sp.]|uniref:YihY/virulence factor BrkB family protein n=1 Tax=Microbacterium sp. TaxID=51671 RepID=UPI002FE22FF0